MIVVVYDAQYTKQEFLNDAHEMQQIEQRDKRRKCKHERWRWLDCDECRETIGACGEKVCEDCGADVR